MNKTNELVRVKSTPITITTQLPVPNNIDPATVLAYAQKAAKALTDVINTTGKIIINGQSYISFEHWQTIARFYGTTVGIESTKQIVKNDKVIGFEARAVAYNNGQIISAAEASCLREERNWSDRPEFQLKSMAQTRAGAKCLRNIYAWVVVLAGYKPTPVEEMDDMTPIKTLASSNTERGNELKEQRNEISRNWEKQKLTEKQRDLLFTLISERYSDDEGEMTRRLNEIPGLTKSDASDLIKRLITVASIPF
jgi:hypothetical protein